MNQEEKEGMTERHIKKNYNKGGLHTGFVPGSLSKADIGQKIVAKLLAALCT